MINNFNKGFLQNEQEDEEDEEDGDDIDPCY